MKLSWTFITAATCALAVPAHATNFDFWYGNTGSIEAAIQRACQDFNSSQQTDKVNCVGQGSYDAAMQKAIAAYRSKTHPVLIQFVEAGTLDLMLSGAVVPVAEFLSGQQSDDIIPGARSYYETSKGELISQPYNGSTIVLYGNSELLAKAGLSELPKTWEDLAAAAQKLKDVGVGCPFVTDADPWRVLEQFSARHGIAIASKNNGYDGLDATYTFNSSLVAQHMSNLEKWHKSGLVKLNQDTAAGNYTAAFNSGECAMMEGSTGSFGAAYKALGDKVEVALAPMYSGHERYNTLIGGGSLWMMKNHSAEEYRAAGAFLNFLREPETQLKLTESTGYIPITKAGLEELRKAGSTGRPELAVADLGAVSLSVPSSPFSKGIRLGFFVKFRELFKEETQKAFNGQQPMQSALDSAATKGDALLRRFEQTYRNAKQP